MRIFLLGFMGCGKTTIGKKVANKLQIHFIDMDDYIVKKEKNSINEIFARYGEEVFRQKEQEALHDMFNINNVLVATGGGAPCFFDNILQLNKHGKAFYLKVSPQVLSKRLWSIKAERPLIKDKTPDELNAYVAKTIAYREQFYNQAQYIIDTSEMSVVEVVDEITGRLK